MCISVLIVVQICAACYSDIERRYFTNVKVLPCGPVTLTRENTLAYVVPAYLNNEADILDETLDSYCSLEFDGRIHVIVVYNSKGDMGEAEAKIEAKIYIRGG